MYRRKAWFWHRFRINRRMSTAMWRTVSSEEFIRPELAALLSGTVEFRGPVKEVAQRKYRQKRCARCGRKRSCRGCKNQLSADAFRTITSLFLPHFILLFLVKTRCPEPAMVTSSSGRNAMSRSSMSDKLRMLRDKNLRFSTCSSATGRDTSSWETGYANECLSNTPQRIGARRVMRLERLINRMY